MNQYEFVAPCGVRNISTGETQYEETSAEAEALLERLNNGEGRLDGERPNTGVNIWHEMDHANTLFGEDFEEQQMEHRDMLDREMDDITNRLDDSLSRGCRTLAEALINQELEEAHQDRQDERMTIEDDRVEDFGVMMSNAVVKVIDVHLGEEGLTEEQVQDKRRREHASFNNRMDAGMDPDTNQDIELAFPEGMKVPTTFKPGDLSTFATMGNPMLNTVRIQDVVPGLDETGHDVNGLSGLDILRLTSPEATRSTGKSLSDLLKDRAALDIPPQEVTIKVSSSLYDNIQQLKNLNKPE